MVVHTYTQQMVLMPLPMMGYMYEAPMKPFELPAPAPTEETSESPPLGIFPSPFAPIFGPRTAICVLRTDMDQEGDISGGVFVTQELEGGPIILSGTVQGLKPGNHGFHLHRDPISANDCNTAGPHFNPFNVSRRHPRFLARRVNTHGGPNDKNRHGGDFGNIEANELGVAFVSIQIPGDMISVESGGEMGIIGRSIVIHENEDDLGKGGTPESLKTGGAGKRQACCLLMNLPTQPTK
ncbi:hypothetical protein J437_LFUL011210 [Ladona fulva]|uniref:Superoxide dismutase copper/zinc binding domain-containing protein n=1 Tax=Ladona fulva TaxID=123851 RepID=A0A8K0KB51_LADFU|nr:hypothetical protein J437_LFUL011210 [Ladona fulva]